MNSYERRARDLLALADVRVDGNRPWDIQVRDPHLYQRVFRDGELGFGEAYGEGWWNAEDPVGLLRRIIGADLESKIPRSPALIALGLRARFGNLQTKAQSRIVGQDHYDLPSEIIGNIYCGWRRQATCAVWDYGATDIDEAQEDKLCLTALKLQLEPGMRVLDIGCGWGGLMGFMANEFGSDCTGITISAEQVKYVNETYGPDVRAIFKDYREMTGQFDRVVSVGMFEHVGSKNYDAYFAAAHRCLEEGGIFLLHTIMSLEESAHTSPFLHKYIFRNGQLPTAKQVLAAAEGRFVLQDFQNFGTNYARTLAAWRANLNAKWPVEVAPIWDELVARPSMPELFRTDAERVRRLLNYYLFSCEAAFREHRINVGQFVFSKGGLDQPYVRPALPARS